MTMDQIKICRALGTVRYLPASFDKRFGNGLSEMDTAKELTEKQNEWAYRLLYKYRRQLPSLYEKFKGHQYCSRKK